MDSQPEDLIFHTSPLVQFASNTFLNVPVILQFENTPLIEVVRVQRAGFSTRFHIFHPDGTKLAKVDGSRLFLTPEGKSANLSLRHPAGATVCELDGKTLFEIRRTEAAAVRMSAELYTPEGAFLRANDSGVGGRIPQGGASEMEVAGVIIQGCDFKDLRIGVLVRANGQVLIPGG